MNPTKKHHQVLCKSQKNLDGDPAMTRQAFGGQCMNRTWKVQTHRDRKKCGTCEEQSQEHAHNFFDIKGTVHEEFFLAGQTVNSSYYCEVLRCLPENV
jgi:hypothetical protein